MLVWELILRFLSHLTLENYEYEVWRQFCDLE